MVPWLKNNHVKKPVNGLNVKFISITFYENKETGNAASVKEIE